mmetsp:Transcript_29093/g.84547  ORF Transcript_29093/g.84547 Transcript_29093/m.84547 type:complete len:311 (-) Transcript_29093:987-1919(-)
MLGNEIAKVLDIGVALDHRCRQISKKPKYSQIDTVYRSSDVPVRPPLHPGSEGCEQGAYSTAAHDPLHRLVGTSRPSCGCDIAQLGFAIRSADKVGADIAEGERKPRPKDEDGTGGHGKVHELWKEGWQRVSFLTEEGKEGLSKLGQAGRSQVTTSDSSNAHPKRWYVAQQEHAGEGSTDLRDTGSLFSHCQKPAHGYQGKERQTKLVQIGRKERSYEHTACPNDGYAPGGINACVHNHSVVLQLTQNCHEGEHSCKDIVTREHPACYESAHGGTEQDGPAGFAPIGLLLEGSLGGVDLGNLLTCGIILA